MEKRAERGEAHAALQQPSLEGLTLLEGLIFASYSSPSMRVSE